MAKFEVNEELVRKLADLLQETGLNEIEYEINNHRIRVAKGAGAVSYAPAPAAPCAPAAVAAAPGAEAVPAGAVTAPMVGTVYVASGPGTPPFVKVGDQVSEGQTLLIIEAMKVMNPLASPRAGTVTQVLISDGQPVEYGEPLLVIE
ncbi:acetyl-CoA carboxylase, biotin carboxyl carrier protein [Pelagibius litoralis]|uniref:Biotin carboxyl carrier protein of acetyl-CoA carboxylase n=1 Tax=Pelagibius litoralis TaxID=374515 RepID=A0A967C718_9PROT|nr:acetyl-CoA carboxylase biotin carboxyl carrier protein subunit [Pelagibius litoralis]NIA68771.1 acetyl-CoA carboxylase, biotin carboxyl carrier protein [Pelagibius litoralis]